jgi:hypothetical protein
LLGRAAELCERWGRSEGLACGCARRAEGFRTTDGDDGVAVDMMPSTWAQGAAAGLRCEPARWVSRAGVDAIKLQWTQQRADSAAVSVDIDVQVKVPVGVRLRVGAATLADEMR